MKRCPQCNRTFSDDALSFCLDDGSPLASATDLAAPESSLTMQYPSPRETTPQQPTMAYRPGQMPPPPPPPAWSPAPMPQPQKRSVWPWLIGIGVVLVLMGIGVVVLVIAIASITSNNNNNRSANANANNSNWRANRNSNANASTANTNTNTTTSSLVSFTDDFSAENWGSGSSKFGRTWYDNDEYHMHGTKNGYIVMYAPNPTQYGTENATVRITTRNVEGTETGKGYGLLVHAEMKNNQLEDYGFLIDNGTKGYYRVIEHKGGAETQLVSWTASSTIRTGTSPNQLEVRIRDHKIEFYINGQYVTSINDGEGFLRGKVGLYTSDASEVAFDDLEVSR
jgi:hypothetical protein